jgi:hypothetical protein
MELTRNIRFNVGGDAKDDVPFIQPDNPPRSPIIACVFESAGRLLGKIPNTNTGGAWLYYQKARKMFRIILPPIDVQGEWEAFDANDPTGGPCFPPEYNGDREKVALHYAWSYELPVLQRVGRYWRRNGDRFFLNGATGFNAMGVLYGQGEQVVRQRMRQREDLGLNAIRFWTGYDVPLVGRLVPKEHPHFYDEDLPALCSIAAEFGQYPYVTGFTGAYGTAFNNDPGQLRDHDARLAATLAAIPYAFYDRRNESTKDVNQTNALSATPPYTPVWSQGSNQQDEDPPKPYGLFYARHPASSEWQRKVGKQNIDFANGGNVDGQMIDLPGVDDETVRLEPAGEMNIRHCHDAGACGAFFIAGAFVHSRQLKAFDLLTADGELNQVAAWCDGVYYIWNRGLDIVQDGEYHHLTGRESSEIVRSYQKVLGAREQTLDIGY